MTSMAASVSAIIAVLGTLLGSALTYVFQRRADARSHEFSFHQQLRTERIAAYTAFAVACSEYRRGQHDRWRRQDEEPGGAAAFNARIESYRLKGIALQALLQVPLVANDGALVGVAKQAYDLTTLLHRSATPAELDIESKKAKSEVESFIVLASHDVQSAPRKIGTLDSKSAKRHNGRFADSPGES